MPDIGLLELILIGVVAFLVLGPERMPELFSQVGRAVRHARNWIADMKQQVARESETLRHEVDGVKGEIDDAVSGGISTMPDEEKHDDGKTS